MRNSSTLSFVLAIGEINKAGSSRNLAVRVRTEQLSVSRRKEPRDRKQGSLQLSVALVDDKIIFFTHVFVLFYNDGR
jgi:hypothetical protein